MSIQIPTHIREASRDTWQTIGPDVEQSRAALSGAIEETEDEKMLSDAGMCVENVRVYGGEDGDLIADQIVELFKQHGQDPVLRALAEKCF
jgi:hypothetical protein